MRYAIVLIGIIFSGSILNAQNSRGFVFKKKKPVDNFFFVNTGASSPTSPQSFSDFWDRGLNIGFGFGKRLDPNNSLTVAADYNRFALNEPAITDRLQIEDQDNFYSGGGGSVISATVNFKSNVRNPREKLRPYIYGGFGFIRGSTGKILINENTEEEIEIAGTALTSFALSFGSGLDYRLSTRQIIFAELRYVMGLEETAAQYIGLKFGFTID